MEFSRVNNLEVYPFSTFGVWLCGGNKRGFSFEIDALICSTWSFILTASIKGMVVSNMRFMGRCMEEMGSK